VSDGDEFGDRRTSAPLAAMAHPTALGEAFQERPAKVSVNGALKRHHFLPKSGRAREFI
jgi:hypothetical protein